MTLSWSKNKKGAALVYAIMVLLLLTTVIVALTALSTASYTDAVLAASDDQSYYFAKSIGLAVKEQFKDGYNIARIIAELDRQEADLADKGSASSFQDPKVTGSFTIADDKGDLVTGTVQIRYARDEDNNVNTHVIEVRAACVVNNSPAAVTSIFSCEDETGDELNYLEDALVDYDVILTDTNNLSFDFSQASDSSSSALSVYVYAGEDDNVPNPTFFLRVDMGGKLTTTGKTTIESKAASGNDNAYHKITGNMTAYGDLVVEGRDITTAVFPESPARFYLTASAEARARRRRIEEVEKGIANQSEDAVKASLLARDAIDSTRKYAPLRKADGVYEIDSSDMTLEQVVDAVLTKTHEVFG